MGVYARAVENLVVVVNGQRYVPATNALALAQTFDDHLEEQSRKAVDRSWDMERLRQYDEDNFVADGQWK